MNKTFAALKTEAANASSPVELYRIAMVSGEKLQRNIGKAQLLAYTNGRAAEAHHYFENVIPGWQKINNEILAMVHTALNGRTAEEIISIITEAGEAAA
jgi:hypothetical protein